MTVSQKTMHKDLIYPEKVPRGGNLLTETIGRIGLILLGWRVVGEFANIRKSLFVIAPHSSNWDWVIGVLCLMSIRLKINYLIKDAAFIGPLGTIIRASGGIPVDRSNPQTMVTELTRRLETEEEIYCGITPEGTRKQVTKWKTGFLRLAYESGLPVASIGIDYGTKRFVIGKPFELSGDLEADLESIKAYFSQFKRRREA